MITAVSTLTATKAIQLAGQPASVSGTSSFHTTRQLKRKLKRACAPVHPPNAQSSAQKAPKSTAIQPRRQWSRATSSSPGFAPPGGTMTSAVSPTRNCLSSSAWARISLFARKRPPFAEPESTSTSRCCEP